MSPAGSRMRGLYGNNVHNPGATHVSSPYSNAVPDGGRDELVQQAMRTLLGDSTNTASQARAAYPHLYADEKT